MGEPYFCFFHGDYLKDTLDLTAAQDGMYIRLLIQYYTQGYLESDLSKLYRICRAIDDAEKAAVDYVVDRYFIRNGNGHLINKKAEEELSFRKKFIEEQNRKSKLGVEARKRRLSTTRTLPGDKPAGQPDGKPVGSPGGQPYPSPSQTPTSTPLQTTACGGKEGVQGEERSFDPRVSGGGSLQKKSQMTVKDPSGVEHLVPPCDHEGVICLYHEILPMLPQIKVWEGTPKQHLAQRWKDHFIRRVKEGKAGGLPFWRWYFKYVRQSDFLTGRRSDGKRQWVCNLRWLVNPTNFQKVVNGEYHDNKTEEDP